MSIEIKELVIRAVVEPGRATAAGAALQAAPVPVLGPGPDGEDRAAIIAACVKEIWRRLEKRRER